MLRDVFRKHFDCTEVDSEGLGGLGKMFMQLELLRIDNFMGKMSNIFGTAEEKRRNNAYLQRFDLN